MKKMFPGFYSPTDEELDAAWKSDDTLFVFDTNTLLNLYGYASQTRDDFFSILDAISDRIWLPYHVGLEYQRRRLDVIKEEKGIFKNVEAALSNIDKVFEHELQQLALKRRFPTLSKKTDKLHTDIKKMITDYKKSLSYWDGKQPCVRGHDNIREKLNDLFEDKIGDIPESQTFLDAIYKEGEKRYENKVPPGYKDVNKANKSNDTFSYAGLDYNRQYGDLLIWKQLIQKAKEETINKVIFITDDAKEDWWYIINSRGEKNIGPRAELREEICRDGDIEFFTMYNTSEFLDSGKKLLNMDIHTASIDDASQSFKTPVLDIKQLLDKERQHYNALANAYAHAQKLDANKLLDSENVLYSSGLAKAYADAQKEIWKIAKIQELESIKNSVNGIIGKDNLSKLENIYKTTQNNLESIYGRRSSDLENSLLWEGPVTKIKDIDEDNSED